jgi:hypothetical protein
MTAIRRSSRATSQIGDLGENVVANAIVRLLGWQPRKDPSDNGIDHNVEIPSEGDLPSVRFLIQVKTEETLNAKRNGHWSIKFKRAALAKYAKSRHAVFGFKVDLATDEIRWLDVLASMKAQPGSMTFDLPPSQVFNKSTAETFAKSVRFAIAELDDKYHAPARGLEYRAKRFEALDPRFEVKADLIDGVERYSFGVRLGEQAKLRIVANSEEDSKKIQSAIEYGTKVNIRGQLKGSPIVQHDGSVESHLTLTPKARDFRLGITTELDGHRFYIELPAETSFGTQGAEIRTTDPKCPFKITMQFDRGGIAQSYTFEIDYKVWDRERVTELSLFDQTYQFAQSLANEHRFRLDYIDYGTPKELVAGVVDKPDPGYEDTFKFLEILRKLRMVCRELGTEATFKEGIEVTVDDQLSIIRAYELLEGKTLPFEGTRFTLTLGDEATDAEQLLQSGNPAVGLQMANILANVSFAGSAVASIPVTAAIKAFKIVSRSANKLRIETLPGSTITRVSSTLLESQGSASELQPTCGAFSRHCF